jgi:polysaccharide export outer membrane protein
MTARFHSKNIASSLAGALALAFVAGSVSFAAQQPSQLPSPAGQPAAPPTTPTTVPPATPTTAPPTTPPTTPGVTVPEATPPVTAAPAAVMAAPGVNLPPEYTIGADDVLSVIFWRDKELSSDVTVRPDGKISLPLLNDVHASGLTPAQLKDRIVEESKKYVEDPNVTVVVKDIKSRKVFMVGEVRKPGPYAMTAATTVLQMISIAGGLADFARPEKISIVRTENGKPVSLKFNYKEVLEGKKLVQNIELKPGDTIIVP